jgi:acyl-CoA dehydrogenase
MMNAAETHETQLMFIEKGIWPTDLWRNVEEAGLPWAAVPESAGGAGGTIGDLAAILREAGRYAVPLPLAETGLGAMLAAQAGLILPPGPLALVVADADSPMKIVGSKVTGRNRRTPFASVASNLVVVAPYNGSTGIAMVPRAAANITAGQSQTGEPYDDVSFEDASAAAVAEIAMASDRAQELLALARVNQMSGAAERVLAITTQYALERVQFGRPIGNVALRNAGKDEVRSFLADDRREDDVL